MKPSIVSVVYLTAVLSASAQTLPSLLDALRASGASTFADQITADPTIAALYLSDQVQTVFAPNDNAYSAGLRKRLTPAQQQALLLQCTQGQATLQSMRTLPGGSQITTQDTSTKLKGKKQSVISDPRPKNTTKAAKRDTYPPAWSTSEPSFVSISRPYYPPTWTDSEPLESISHPYYSPAWSASEPSESISRPYYPPTWSASAPPESISHPFYPPKWTPSAPWSANITRPSVWTTWPTSTTWPTPTPTPSPTSLVKIYSGLGNSVNVIQADIQYAGGLIQIIDGEFTLPASLSETEPVIGINTFASLAGSANLTDTFDNIPATTFFIPSDEAFASSNVSSPSGTTASLLEGHVIPNFIGYLPSLVNGSTLTTQAGSVVTVTIQGDNYYINNALIITSNAILENGVAHVIDQVLTPAPQVFIGAASSTIEKGTMGAFVTAVTAALCLAMMF